MRPCQGHFQNSRKCDFLVYIFYSLFSCTHREVKSVPLLPAQPRAARHERRCRNPLAVLFRCGAERALMPAGSAHLFPRPRLLSALEGGVPAGHPQQPLTQMPQAPSLSQEWGLSPGAWPLGEGANSSPGSRQPLRRPAGVCPSPVPGKHSQKPGAGLGALPWLWGARPPAPHPQPRCSNVVLPFSQPGKSDGSRPPARH